MITAKVKLTKDLVEAIMRRGEVSEAAVYVAVSHIEFDNEPVGYVAVHPHIGGAAMLAISKEPSEVKGRYLLPGDLEEDTPLYTHPQTLPDDVVALLSLVTKFSGGVVQLSAKNLMEKYGVEVGS